MNRQQEKRVTEAAMDPEILTMRRVHRLLAKLPPQAAQRVIKYITDRMAEPKQGELPLEGTGAGA